MKITKSQLRRIIQEELQYVLSEATTEAGQSYDGMSREFDPSSRRDINAAHKRYKRTGGTSGISRADWLKARRTLARAGRRRQTRQQGMQQASQISADMDTQLAPVSPQAAARVYQRQRNAPGLLEPGAGGYAELPSGTQPGDVLDTLRTGAGSVMNPPAENTTEPPPKVTRTKTLADRHRARQAQRAAPSPGSAEDWQQRLDRYRTQKVTNVDVDQNR